MTNEWTISLKSYESYKLFRDLVDAIQPFLEGGMSDFYLDRAIRFAKRRAELKRELLRLSPNA